MDERLLQRQRRRRDEPCDFDLQVAEQLRSAVDPTGAAFAGDWPGVVIPIDDFLQFLAVRLHDRERPSADAVRALRTSDLYLACACLQGMPDALRLFRARLLEPLLPRLRRLLGKDSDAAARLLSSVEQELLERRHLDDYSGAIALAVWLEVAAFRIAKHGVVDADESRAERLATAVVLNDPPLNRMRVQFGEEFADMFWETVEGGLAALSPARRNLMRWRLLQRVSFRRLAVVRGVPRATMEELFVASVEEVRGHVRDVLCARTSLRPEEVDPSLMATVPPRTFGLREH